MTGEGYDCNVVQPPAGLTGDQLCPLCKLVVKNAYQVKIIVSIKYSVMTLYVKLNTLIKTQSSLDVHIAVI